MNGTNSLLITAAIMILVLCFFILNDKKRVISNNKSFFESLALMVPLVTALGLLLQWYSTWRRQVSDRKVFELQAVDRLWTEILRYMHENIDDIRPLYNEMFPGESSLLSDQAQPLAGAQIHHKEIIAAHKIAQVTEDILTYHFGPGDNEKWIEIQQRWWRSSRLQKIWRSISYAYEDDTVKVIQSFIQKAKNG